MPSTTLAANDDAAPVSAQPGVSTPVPNKDVVRQVVVVGAGPAGLSAALELERLGVRPLVLDQAEQVAGSWRARYDRLRLNTPAAHSHLPGRRFPKGTPTFPTRDQLIGHLERASRSEGIDVELRTRVERIMRGDKRWLVQTSNGAIQARHVLVATGYECMPSIPAWNGRDTFAGRLLHSSDYKNPAPFRDQEVLVVGPGSSGMEIAYDLAEGGAAKVWLSARTAPNIFLREGPGGLPGDYIAVLFVHLPVPIADRLARFARRKTLGDLTDYGLPIPDEGVFARFHRLGVTPAVIDPEVIDAIKTGRIQIVPGTESLDLTGARLSGGGRVEPDAIICATGYTRGLEPLVGHLDVLDEHGIPRARGKNPAAEGLRFIGYTPHPGQLAYIGKQAKQAAKTIASEL
jgi:cation diffusion facilitator CzcD-associated flavoprotein CzcO